MNRIAIYTFLCVLTALTAFSTEAIIAGSGTDDSADRKGPTLYLGLQGHEKAVNEIESFMYFVPMISPVTMKSSTSEVNTQKVTIIDCKRDISRRDFEISCVFEVTGQGSYRHTYDARQMIEWNTRKHKKGDTVKNLLDYIEFTGSGRGSFEIKGRFRDGNAQVEEVEVNFSRDGKDSPVTVGLYSIEAKNGRYHYDNRTDERIAQIEKLAFKDTEGNPKMSIKVGSVRDADKDKSLFGSLCGMIANLLIDPIAINKQGNDAMLDLGMAIYEKQETFTFRKAANLSDTR
ncbi:hypothetical protein STSP2_01771 [Anaerohalosphaera lusitana]|uniref:Uncharacterized protein n=1 Tax=Anaerohalosphaera lusitana TaxID=1936003 RepID=A0A1U9NKY9_9BACT|nr:hypothetical protein [Anaerohalosphaera lusitana]AQT68603.1 hypothetical protein STSP2_01771 [Anaerohalosphaera lusitana]